MTLPYPHGVIDPNLPFTNGLSPYERGYHIFSYTTEELIAELARRMCTSPSAVASAVSRAHPLNPFEGLKSTAPKQTPTPKRKAAEPLPEADVNSQHSTSQRSGAKNKKPKLSGAETTEAAKTPHGDLSDVVLAGEETDNVMIFDTCDEIRRKMSAYLRRNGVTQASFLRELQAQLLSVESPRKLQQNQLARFRGYKGPMHGNTSTIYYAAYVFFEKLRIKEGKDKTELRLGMESRWPEGVDTKRSHEGTSFSADTTPVMDKYGQFQYLPDTTHGR